MPSNYYRRNNYDFVIDSSFSPFTLQEMLVPFSAYKDAYEEVDNAYTELTDKASTFKYLADNVDPNSKAAQIYKGYANDLQAQADDLTKNGLTMGNRRALSALKRRYKGEIGLLDEAQTRLRKEQDARDAMRAKGIQMFYATENPTIDDYLYDNTPNVYGISQEDLRKRGAEIGQSASSKIYSNPQVSNITKYYQDILETQGYSPELMAAFRRDLSAIPELNDAINGALEDTGVNANLTGRNYQMAKQSIINGVIDGAIYKEAHSVKDNPGVLTAAQATSDSRLRQQMELSALQQGYELKDGKWVFNPELLKEVNSAIEYDKDTREMGPDNKWHKKTTKKTETIKPPSDPKVWFDREGNMGQVSTSRGNYQYGKKMDDYNTVLEKYPSMIDYDPNLYDFWETNRNGKWIVHPRPKTAEAINSSNTSTSTQSNEDDGDNTNDV